MDRYFRMGFVLGVTRSQIDIVGPPDDPYVGKRIGECFTRSRVELATLYDAAIAEAKSKPEEYGYPAVGPILKTIDKICPERRRE